jgi:hypothetical protein
MKDQYSLQGAVVALEEWLELGILRDGCGACAAMRGGLRIQSRDSRFEIRGSR